MKELEAVGRGIRECTRCERCRTRRLAVPGEGPSTADAVFVGEAPGRREDAMGLPFVGQSGRYLDGAMADAGLSRGEVFITSILKCYHPESPRKPQIEACRPWTRRQLELVRPRRILVMGLWAAWGLLGIRHLGTVPLDAEWHGIPCVVTCHPASARRFRARDVQFRRDLDRLARQVLARTPGERAR